MRFYAFYFCCFDLCFKNERCRINLWILFYKTCKYYEYTKYKSAAFWIGNKNVTFLQHS